MDRPYRDRSGQEVRDLIETHWEDFRELGLLAYEVQFRALVEKEQKAALIERLMEIGVSRERPPEEQEPDFEFPTIDIREGRRVKRAALGDVPWHEVGLLSLSGYRVGRARGESRQTRRRLLNYIFLRDDLSDIDDRAYASEWGAPATSARLKKLAFTLATFASNAASHPSNMSQAIADWREDLEYLKTQFYDRWGEFPWPDVEV